MTRPFARCRSWFRSAAGMSLEVPLSSQHRRCGPSVKCAPDYGYYTVGRLWHHLSSAMQNVRGRSSSAVATTAVREVVCGPSGPTAVDPMWFHVDFRSPSSILNEWSGRIRSWNERGYVTPPKVLQSRSQMRDLLKLAAPFPGHNHGLLSLILA